MAKQSVFYLCICILNFLLKPFLLCKKLQFPPASCDAGSKLIKVNRLLMLRYTWPNARKGQKVDLSEQNSNIELALRIGE